MLDSKLNRKPLSLAAWIAIVVVLAALAVPAAAVGVFQTGAGSFSGTLRDPQGRAIPNASVTLTQTAGGAVQKAQTDAAGAFTFSNLQPGEYRLDHAIRGFRTQYPVTVRPGQKLQTDITLRLGQVTEEIYVSSRPGTPSPPPPVRQPPPPPPAYDAAADPCRKPGVSACVKPPIKTIDVRPVVPAGKEGVEAVVVIDGEIGTDGTMQGARLSKPTDTELGQAGLDAVKKWLFTPTRLNGEPVPTAITITINFKRQSEI